MSTRHKGPRRDSTSADAIETAQRHAEWFKLRLAAKSYREIAELHGVHHSTVQEAISRRLKETLAEPANELRELELGRLDALIDTAWTEATSLTATDGKEHGTKLAYMEQVRKLLADRRKMLGLDAPSKVQHSFERLSDEELAAELEKAGVIVQGKGELNG